MCVYVCVFTVCTLPQVKVNLTFTAVGVKCLAINSGAVIDISRDDVVYVDFTPINRAHQLRLYLANRTSRHFLGFKRAVRSNPLHAYTCSLGLLRCFVLFCFVLFCFVLFCFGVFGVVYVIISFRSGNFGWFILERD